jgi:uncharacterized glyoxalase superfamily protein PhnB
MQPIDNNSIIIPILRYRDGAIAIEWLCRVFGFEQQLVVPDENGAIAYAQLVYGNGMIILAATTNDEFHKLVKSPVGEIETGSESTYIVVQDLEAHYAQAIGAGAEIVIDINHDPWGGRSYSCRDLEGHIWNFGSYDPRRY